jgi:ABC-type antimicrobial peptide transport system permease subunit
MGMVVRQGLAMTSLGLVAGLALAFALARSVAGISFSGGAMGASASLMGDSSTDPLVYVAAALFLYAIAAIAALLPARRAAAIEPMKALRAE